MAAPLTEIRPWRRQGFSGNQELSLGHSECEAPGVKQEGCLIKMSLELKRETWTKVTDRVVSI